MKRKLLLIILISLGLILWLSGCNPMAGEEEATPPPPGPVTAQQDVVSAEAFVVPVKKAELSFEVNGRVIELLVEEGETVTQGQVLARLDDSVKQADLAQQEANLAIKLAALARAEAELAETKAPPKPEEIAEREAALAKQEAILAERLSGPTPEEIGQREAAIRTARAGLQQKLAGSRDEEIQAQAAVVLQREATVRDKQRDYDKVRYGDPEDVGIAGTELQRATLEYEQALAEYERLLNGSTDEEIAIEQAQVAEREADLAEVLAGYTAEQIAQAQADVAQAEAALANLLAGATDEAIAVQEAAVRSAEADVDAAQAQVDRIKAELKQYELVAPFDGVVGLITFDEGEMVSSSGDKSISVGNLSQWQVETDDLTEIDIVEVSVGQSVEINVDALPEATYKGTVVRVNPRSETKAGDVTYTVLIDITEGDPERLKWGMTTFVDVQVSE